MNRILASVGILAVLITFGGGTWLALQPPVGPFLVAGATNVTVTSAGWNEWQLSYEAPNARWLTTVARNLTELGWDRSGPDGYSALSHRYDRASPAGAYVVWEWAFVSIDPARPRMVFIILRRRFDFPWLP